jgi:mannosylglycerate hydrolase
VGLREVELDEEGNLSLTLLRCVGWLSRGDLPNRGREAGPNLPTPGAQGIGIHGFDYAVAFQDLQAPVSEMHRKLEPMLFTPRVTTVTEPFIEDLPLLSVEPASVRLAAIKRAEHDARMIIRLVGADSGEAVEAALKFYRPVEKAWRSDLDERRGEELQVLGKGIDTRVTVRVPPRDVVTVAVVLEPLRG